MVTNLFGFVLDGRRQLFVDDMLVEKTENLQKVLHPPRKYEGNPVLCDAPEGNEVVLHGTVLFDEKDRLFKVWYLSRNGEWGIRYAYSEDGLNWVKPDLKLFGDDSGNLVHNTFADGWSVMLDTEYGIGRYKVFFYGEGRDGQQHIQTGFSEDGIRWHLNHSPAVTRIHDSLLSDANTCMWDTERKRFIGFTKQEHLLARPEMIGDMGVMLRTRAVTFSDDFIHWTKPVGCLTSDDQDRRDMQLYNQCAWNCYGMYVGLVEAYYSNHNMDSLPLQRDIQLVTSRDGKYWNRAGNRETFLGLTEGGFDSQMLDINAAGPIRRDGELWFYYGGRTYPHDSHPDFFPNVFPRTSGIGLAKLRLDGYVSYDAKEQRGILQTRPIRFKDAKRLFVNADLKNGSLRAVVCDVVTSDSGPVKRGIKYDIGAEMDSYSAANSIAVKGVDSTALQLKWKNTEMLPRDKDWISIKFIIENGSLYSFWSE